MDPLSIIASIAGISTAGISLSLAIYDVVSSVRNAPREVSAIARGLSDLSFILRELRRVLKDGKDIYHRKLIRRVASAVKRVGRVQGEIEALLDGSGGLTRLKWIFRKSKAMELLYAIESHKTGISMILHIMMLAVQLKQLSRSLITIDDDENNDTRNDAELARHQAENMVQVSYHSLQELTTEDLNGGTRESNDESEQGNASSDQQVQVWTRRSYDDGAWLYNLVFSTAVEVIKESEQDEKDQASVSDDVFDHLPRDNCSASTLNVATSQSIILRPTSTVEQLQALTQEPLSSTLVVNELLSEWTTLTEDEIQGIGGVEPKANHDSHKPTMSSPADEEVQMVSFKDAIDRKYELPFYLIKKWYGMEELIKWMFLHVKKIGPHRQTHRRIYDAHVARGGTAKDTTVATARFLQPPSPDESFNRS
ncbi:hypothetical protein HD806DRAFT_525351 [Xylariaceae sp. AK1471]|nr:hypothetical protein HD806DRAFT_525351 [Xylariaceae sp. AK1471]